jgi:hypothetical protein
VRRIEIREKPFDPLIPSFSQREKELGFPNLTTLPSEKRDFSKQE